MRSLDDTRVKDLGLAGYVDPWSAAPGEAVRCMVSAPGGSYDARVVELRRGGPRPKGAAAVESWPTVPMGIEGRYDGEGQSLFAGSYCTIPASVPMAETQCVSLVAWVCPTAGPTSSGPRAVVVAHGPDGAVGLGIGSDGSAAILMREGDGYAAPISTGVPLVLRRWWLVGAAIDLTTGAATVWQLPQRAYPLVQQVAAAEGSVAGLRLEEIREFTIGAARLKDARTSGDGTRRSTTAHFDGKIDRPRVIPRRLGPEHLEQECSGGTYCPAGLASLGDWDLSKDIDSCAVRDVSGNGLHGWTVNSPTRAVTGRSWSGRCLDWRHSTDEYGAIHFHSDDIDDAAWAPSFEFRIPGSVRSGAYGVVLEDDKGDQRYVIPFFVHPNRDGPRKDVCVVLPTWSYLAYSNWEGSAVDAEAVTGSPAVHDDIDAVIDRHPELGWSMYNYHADGSGIVHASRRRPMLDMQPDHRFWLSGGGGWAVSGDMYLLDWLNAMSVEFDVVTDDDVHREGADLLLGYKAVMSGSHPEYVSERILDALDQYAMTGGHLLYLGGNGYYWVTNALSDRSHVIEIRRGHAGTRTWEGAPGEGHLSATGEPGGLWRHRGRAPQELVGVGFCAQGGGGSAPYAQLPDRDNERVAFIFDGIDPAEVIGNFGNNMGGAAGDEVDRADHALGTPPHALVVASSAGLHSDFYLHVVEEVPVMVPNVGGTKCPDVRADMTFFETPGGGFVFSAASIDWSASLSENDYTNNVSRVTMNVLRRALGGGATDGK